MARITVEDCIDKFPSRFELVLVASNRARKLHSGENPTVDKDNDKNTVIALREIAQETLTVDELKNDLIEEYQTITFSEDEDLSDSKDEDEVLNDNSINKGEKLIEVSGETVEDTNHEESSQKDDEKNDVTSFQIPNESSLENDLQADNKLEDDKKVEELTENVETPTQDNN